MAMLELAQPAVVHHVHHDDGHIVGASCGQGRVHEVVRADLRRGRLRGDGLDLAVGHHARKAVGAQDETVALFDVELEVVGVHGGVGAERARDDRAVGVHAGLIGGDLARVHEFLNIGMIAGDADERPLRA